MLSRMKENNSTQRLLLRSRTALKRGLRLTSIFAVQWVFLLRNVLNLLVNCLLWVGIAPLDGILRLVHWTDSRFEDVSTESTENFEQLRQTLWSGGQIGTGGRLSTMLVADPDNALAASGYVDAKTSPLAASASAVCESIDDIMAMASQVVDPTDPETDMEQLQILPRELSAANRHGWRRDKLMKLRRRAEMPPSDGLKPLRTASRSKRLRPRTRHGLRIAFDWRRPKSNPGTPRAKPSAAPLAGAVEVEQDTEAQ